MGNNFTPFQTLDPKVFAFFKGVNDNGDGNGAFQATVDQGLKKVSRAKRKMEGVTADECAAGLLPRVYHDIVEQPSASAHARGTERRPGRLH